MKIKILLAILILALGMTGCSSEEVRDLVSEGRTALEKHEYTQARKLLSEALQVDSGNDDARGMYIQAYRMESALKYVKQENYKKAIEDLKVAEKAKGGSSVIKDEASNKRAELEQKQKDYEIAQEERRENAKLTSSHDVDKMEEAALKEQQKQLEEQKKQEEEEKLKQEQEQNNQQIQDSQAEQNQNGTITLKPNTSAQQKPQENKPQTILVP
jgi:hypothetical protein